MAGAARKDRAARPRAPRNALSSAASASAAAEAKSGTDSARSQKRLPPTSTSRSSG
jgi:hypothetical protein